MRGPWGIATTVVLIAVVAGSALLLALLDVGRPDGNGGAAAQDPSQSLAQPAPPPPTRSTFTLLQTNLCLSGLAGCYDAAAYPAVLRETVARVRDVRPDAITVNEACRRDVARIARSTGYHLRFSRVIYLGAPLPCIDPGDRGLFGNAVLTKAPVEASAGREFRAQSGIERRGWLCVTTRPGVDVCTAHLSTRRTTTSTATNDAQCAELAALLERRAASRTVTFGGDLNRRRSCAPYRVWTRADRSAEQASGLQHVYGSRATLRYPSAAVLPLRHSDHDVLLVWAQLVPR